MKVERNVRHRRTAGKRWRPAALILAAVIVLLSLPLAGKTVYAVDLGTDCSLKVNVGVALPAEDQADLDEANVVIDAYKIADAVPVAGYDTYAFELLAPYAGREDIVIGDEITSEEWRALSQTVAAYVLGDVPEGTREMAPAPKLDDVDVAASGKAGEAISLAPGLYFVVAHGSDGAYVSTKTDEEAGTSNIVTIADSRVKRYSFTPELIAVPSRIGTDGTNNTANNDTDWQYAVEVTAKYSMEDRVGQLVVEKELDSYEMREKTTDGATRMIKDPATFIFEVTVYDGNENGEELYHDYVSIVFDAYGTKSVLIDNMPANGYAVVREVYSGGKYTTDSDKTATIEPGGEVKVSFENTYDGKNNGGGSVTNHFEYNTANGWVHTELTDNTETSAAAPESTTENQ